MTLEHAIINLLNKRENSHDIVFTESINVLFGEISRLNNKLNDRLPNGGMVSHEAKHSMQPTLKHDTE
jgi:hypothetical protein